MYDFGSEELNFQVYGILYLLDIGVNYGVVDIFVDVVGGCRDRFILLSMVRKYFDVLKSVGCQVFYLEFEFVYLDFIFVNCEEFMVYVVF